MSRTREYVRLGQGATIRNDVTHLPTQVAPVQTIHHEGRQYSPMDIGRTIPMPGNAFSPMMGISPIPGTKVPISGRQIVSAPQPAGQSLVTTDEVLNDQRKAQSMVAQTDYKQIEQAQQQQKAREEEFFATAPTCSVQKLSTDRYHLGNMQPQEVKSLLQNRFYDPAVMKSVMCATESIVYTSPTDLGGVDANERVRHWLDNLKRVGAESEEGVALKADLAQAENVFIVKAPKNPENTELIHEAFIGMYGLNKLRKDVPNFAYIMGAFKCSPPIVDPDTKDVVAWCNNTQNVVNYVIYENIFPGQDLDSYVSKGCTFDQWLGYYLQILYALKLGHEKVGFTHYDLHDQNVILRDLGGQIVAIPYITEEGRTQYLLTDKVATMIDYGMSRIEVGNESFGVYDRTPYSIFPDRAFPIYDAYKLLGFSMHTMTKNKQDECFENAAIIMKFFNTTETAIDITEKQRNTLYYLPYNQKTASSTIDDLLSYIRQNFNLDELLVDTVPADVQILGCEGQTVCLTERGVEAEAGISGPLRARTVFDFYDIMTRLKAENRTDDINKVAQSFNYQIAMQEAVEKYNGLLEELTTKDSRLGSISSIEQLPVQNLAEPDTLKKYKDFISKIADIFDTIQQLFSSQAAIQYAATAYGDTATAEGVANSYIKYIGEFQPKWNGVVDTVRKNNSYLQNLQSTDYQGVNAVLKSNPDMIWWWRYHNQIVQILRPI